jgi:hypothetical protein
MGKTSVQYFGPDEGRVVSEALVPFSWSSWICFVDGGDVFSRWIGMWWWSSSKSLPSWWSGLHLSFEFKGEHSFARWVNDHRSSARRQTTPWRGLLVLQTDKESSFGDLPTRVHGITFALTLINWLCIRLAVWGFINSKLCVKPLCKTEKYYEYAQFSNINILVQAEVNYFLWKFSKSRKYFIQQM